MSDGYPTQEQEEEIAKIEALPVVMELRSQLKFAHDELGRWRDDYARLTHLRQHLSKENKDLKRIAALCKEEIDHGFDLPSEVFDATEAYYAKYGRPATTASKEKPNG